MKVWIVCYSRGYDGEEICCVCLNKESAIKASKEIAKKEKTKGASFELIRQDETFICWRRGYNVISVEEWEVKT
jgi:hypothetical protein